MKAGARHIILFLILSLLIITDISANDELIQDLKKIENLLIQGDIEKAHNIFEQKELSQINDSLVKPNSTYIEKINRLKYLFNYKNYIPFDDPEKLKDYLLIQKGSKNLYTEAISGKTASGLFDRFLENIDNNPKKAAELLVIAQYFYSINLSDKVNKYQGIYNQALELFNTEKYYETIELLENNKFDPGNNENLLLIAEDITLLDEKTEAKIKELESRQFYWENKNKIKSKYLVIASFSINRQAGNEALPIETSNLDTSAIFHLNTSNRFNFGGALEFLYSLSSSLSLGADINFSTYKFQSKDDLRLIHYDFSVNNFSTHIKSVYYFRDKVGLRPFISLGGGLLKYKMNKNEVIDIWNETGTVKTSYYTFEESFSTFQILTEFGLLVQFDSEKSKTLIVKTIFTQNSKESFLINKFHFGLSASIGYAF